MTALHRVHLADVAPTPWKNGGGLTRDLLHWPPAPAPWLCRISVAEIARSGPFSAYPGVARGFCVLQGAGVVLHFEDRSLTLTPDHPPLHFDGAQAPGCDLLDGSTLDLNLMVQQAAGHAELRRAAAGASWVSNAPLRALFTLHGATLETPAGPLTLPVATLTYSTAAAGQAWALATAGCSGWWLSFEAHPR